MESLGIFLIGLLVGGIVLAALWFIRARAQAQPIKPQVELIAEHVRAVGKLIGLEVSAKEIATATKGWSWLPPLLLSQARIAMIFCFDKQYFVDLSRIGPSNVDELAPGRYRLRMPPIEGTLRLTDVQPYDIQDGRLLGLLDVIQMNANTQRQLMQGAQEQASELFTRNDQRYRDEAQRSIERQVVALLGFFDVRVDLDWGADVRDSREPQSIEIAQPI